MDTVLASRTLDPKPIAPALFAHFVLRSANMPAMVDWYSTVLNMHVVKRNDFICFLTYDEEHHRLAIVNIAGLQEPDAKAGAWRTSPTRSAMSASCCRPIAA